MGELFNQLVSGGPELLDLTEKQRELYEEQLQGGEQFAATVVFVLRYVLRDQVIPRAYNFCAETPYEKGGALFFIDLGNYLAMMERDSKPFTEDEFRTLLVWTGHGPAIVHPMWVKIFKESVLEAGLTGKPAFTFLKRLIEAAE